MKKLYPLNIWLVFFWLAACAGFAQQLPNWEIHALKPGGQVNFDLKTGLTTAENGVVISNSVFAITADRITVNQKTGEILAEGSVSFLAKNHAWHGTNILYNAKTDKVSASNFKTGQEPFFISGQNMTGTGVRSNGVYSATGAIVTGDDYAEPAYEIHARHIIIVPNAFFEAYDVTFFLGNVPVFYLPHYKRSFGRHPNNFVMDPGYRTSWGPFLLNRYNWFYSDELGGDLRLDWRQRRGVAGGPDVNYDFGNLGRGTAGYYYANDQDPQADGNPVGTPQGRSRAIVADQSLINSNLLVKGVVRYQSDPNVVRDYFEAEYRKDVQPKSFVEGTQLWPNFVFNAVVLPQVIDFYQTVERLPDLKLTGLRQEIGATPLYYESESSFAYLQQRYMTTNVTDRQYLDSAWAIRNISSTNVSHENYSAARGDTFQQILLPQTYGGFLNVTPRLGGRVTYYSDVWGSNLSQATNEQVRAVLNTGVEVSTKASRVWSDADNQLLDVNGLRHIIEPKVDYVFIPNPTRQPSELPQFDTQLPSLRQLPIDFPDYNSIDSITSQNVMRLGLANRLQTKREGEVQNLLNSSIYTDWNIPPTTNTAFSDIYSETDFRPRSWLTFNSFFRYDPVDSFLRETYQRMVIAPDPAWSFSFTYRYLVNNDPEFQTPADPNPAGFNTFMTSFYYRMNENWGARIAHRFEGADGVLEEQWYTLYRDLRSWTSALTFRVRNNVDQRTDYTVAVTFSLKAFPRFGMGNDMDRPSMLLGN